jgi:hypothetical protein
MSHVRQQIRAAVVARLTGLATTGTRVSASRVHPVARGAGPTLAVYTLDEESERMSIGADPEMDRTLTLGVEVLVQSAEFDDQMDDVCAEVEARLGGWRPGDPKVRELVLVSTEIQPHGEGEVTAGSCVMGWQTSYVTLASDPTIAL